MTTQQQHGLGGMGQMQHVRKRRRIETESGGPGSPATVTGMADEWVVRTGQWRLRIRGAKNGKSAVECVLVAVKIDALSGELARNADRGFLTG